MVLFGTTHLTGRLVGSPAKEKLHLNCQWKENIHLKEKATMEVLNLPSIEKGIDIEMWKNKNQNSNRTLIRQ